jgi:hypothetical protein
MNFKTGVMVSIFYISSSFQACDSEKLIKAVYDFAHARSKNTKILLNPEAIRIRQEQQNMAAASDPAQIEISTDDGLRVALHQIFLYGQKKHKDISFQDFYKTHPEIIENFTQDIQSSSFLDEQVQAHIFDRYTQIPESDRDLPASREIETYKIVGAQPFKDDFFDALYDVTTAKQRMESLTRQFIHKNYEQVYKKCNASKHNPINSQKVISVACCNLPLHYKCLLACKSHQVKSCPNAQCQRAENGTYFQKSWGEHFYEQALQSKPLEIKDIPSGTCSLCEEAFKK